MWREWRVGGEPCLGGGFDGRVGCYLGDGMV